jgi:hypothetical protein
MQMEIGDLEEIERIVADTEFVGSIDRTHTPATLRRRVLTSAQRYSVGDGSQCAGRSA